MARASKTDFTTVLSTFNIREERLNLSAYEREVDVSRYLFDETRSEIDPEHKWYATTYVVPEDLKQLPKWCDPTSEITPSVPLSDKERDIRKFNEYSNQLHPSTSRRTEIPLTEQNEMRLYCLRYLTTIRLTYLKIEAEGRSARLNRALFQLLCCVYQWPQYFKILSSKNIYF
jgi:hypothetical protein